MIVFIFTYKSPFSAVPEFVEEEVKFWPENVSVNIISLADKHVLKTENVSGQKNVGAQSVSPVTLQLILKIFIRSLNREFFTAFLEAISRGKFKNILPRLKQLIHYEFVKHRYIIGFWKIWNKLNVPGKDVLFYSYWLGPATGAAIKIRKDMSSLLSVRVISRAHGSDLYPNAHPSDYLPFLRSNIVNCDKVFCISNNGMTYLKNHLQVDAGKVQVSRLGIPDWNPSNKLPHRDKDIFHIVSCSYLTPVKRIHLIIEALSKIEGTRIKWTHLGGGPLEISIRQYSLDKLGSMQNIISEIIGNLNNEQVIKFYKQNNINLLLNVSGSEGLPVSIMEACCFGIPVIAPDIGGINEIVEKGKNGFLIDKDFSANELVDKIMSLVLSDKAVYHEMCTNSRNIFLNNCLSKINYSNFISRLTKTEVI